MHKRTKIDAKVGVGIGIVVAIFVVLAGFDIYAASNLQFQNKDTSQFDWSDLSVDMIMSVCNPTFMPTSFNQIKAELYYKSSRIGTFTMWGSAIPAYSAKDVDSRVNIDGMNVLKISFGGVMSGLAGQRAEYEEDDFSIDLKVEKSILGIIPFSLEKKYRGSEFASFVQGNKGWNC